MNAFRERERDWNDERAEECPQDERWGIEILEVYDSYAQGAQAQGAGLDFLRVGCGLRHHDRSHILFIHQEPCRKRL